MHLTAAQHIILMPMNIESSKSVVEILLRYASLTQEAFGLGIQPELLDVRTGLTSVFNMYFLAPVQYLATFVAPAIVELSSFRRYKLQSSFVFFPFALLYFVLKSLVASPYALLNFASSAELITAKVVAVVLAALGTALSVVFLPTAPAAFAAALVRVVAFFSAAA